MTRHHAAHDALHALALALCVAALTLLAMGCYGAYSALTQPGCDDIGPFVLCYIPTTTASPTGAYGGYAYGPQEWAP